jgi:asparagine synthase (glutamine-hydrolysing)
MCGIYGFTWGDSQLIGRMSERLAHRGPDGNGIFVDSGISLGCQRLAIIDLSDAARQPMFNENRSLALVYNGEVYNATSIREALVGRGHRFASTTDGEVIVHAFEEYGTDSFALYDGMFAFALYDLRSRALYLVTDHLAIKNLYFTALNGDLLFASECKALFEHPAVGPIIDESVLENIWTYGYNPSPATPFRGIRCLQPGTYLLWKDGAASLHRYWDFRRTGCGADARTLLRALEESVRERLVADVPVAILLSGGLDSSLVLALAVRHRPDLKAFALGFSEDDNEFEYARLAARTFGVDCEEILLSGCDIEADLDKIVFHQETPQDMGSVVPKWYLARRIAQEGYKVVLGGSGADETWFGYRRHPGLHGMLMQEPPPPDLSRRYFDSYVLRQPGPDWLYEEYLSDAPWYDVCMYFDVFHEIPYYHNPRLDKTFMAWGLEYRIPFLDRELVEMSLNTPRDVKMGPSVDKHLLREAARSLLPPEIVSRSKNPLKIPEVVQNRGGWQTKLVDVWKRVFEL